MTGNIFMMLFLLIQGGCANPVPETNTPASSIQDTVRRPKDISVAATLLNFGSDDEKIFVWADPMGPFVNNGKEYAHIQGVKFYYAAARKTVFQYYEHFNLRNGVQQIDFKKFKILNYPGDATLELTHGKDTLLVFRVLESPEFQREYKGTKFQDICTISRNNDGQYVADESLEVNLVRKDAKTYILTSTDGLKIAYKLCPDCNEAPELISFLNREDGRIYFINRKCYVELVNKADVKVFQGLR